MRLRLPAAVLLLCVSSSLLAQKQDDSTPQAPRQPPKPPPATAAITGTVFCSDTHHPARGAVVMAKLIPKNGQFDNNLSASTSRVGLDGTYTIHHLLAGNYTVIALLPGYLSPFDGLQLDETTGPDDNTMREHLTRNGILSVRDGETAHFDLTLERGASVSGRVLYDDGAPATQVIVSVEDINAKPPAPKNPETQKNNPDSPDIDAGPLVRSMFLHQTQSTDDQGNFRIAGLPPGTYRVAATQSTLGDDDDAGDIFGAIFGALEPPRSIHIYSGDTFHKNAAKTFDLRAGEETSGIEITIPIYAFHRVQGHLTTLDGRRISVAGITLTDTSDTSFTLRAHPARDGSFVFPEVPPETTNSPCPEQRSAPCPTAFPKTVPSKPRCFATSSSSPTRPRPSSSKTPTSPISAFNYRTLGPPQISPHPLLRLSSAAH